MTRTRHGFGRGVCAGALHVTTRGHCLTSSDRTRLRAAGPAGPGRESGCPSLRRRRGVPAGVTGRPAAWYCVALNDERWPACRGPDTLPDPNSPLAQSAGPMITARPGVTRPGRLGEAWRAGSPGDDTGTQAVAAHKSSHRHHGMLSTDSDSDSERPLRRWRPGPSESDSDDRC